MDNNNTKRTYLDTYCMTYGAYARVGNDQSTVTYTAHVIDLKRLTLILKSKRKKDVNLNMAIAVPDRKMHKWSFALICMTVMLGSSESCENEPMPTVPCKEGWYLYGETCYGSPQDLDRIDSTKSWEDARQMCLREHGDLATIYSEDLQEFLSAFVLTKVKLWFVWIGLREGKDDKYDVWADGSPVNYTSWGPGDPINRETGDCVAMDKENGSWITDSCHWNYPYLCQAEKDTSHSNPDPRFCPVDKKGGWSYQDSCYHIVKEQMPWEKAECYCQEVYGGHLLEILNNNSQMFINYVFLDESVDFWIGIKIKNQSLQRWSSGWHVEFAKWGEEHRNFSDGTCALMMPKGNWSMAPCDTKHPFICESPKDSPPVLKKAPEGWVCPTTSIDWIDLGGDTCYIYGTEMRLKWHQANIYCNKKGGSLASIHSDAETKILRPHLTGKQGKIRQIFIGLHRSLRNSSIYEWTDGSELDYENWSISEPSEYLNNGCGALYTPVMRWYVVPCDGTGEFLCSAKKVPPDSNQENQTQYQTPVSAPRNSSNEEIS